KQAGSATVRNRTAGLSVHRYLSNKTPLYPHEQAVSGRLFAASFPQIKLLLSFSSGLFSRHLRK
ncbi:MAG: hypothetical protein IKE68_02595, partial [Solobacterium sp.]|nr:hypothetical protein [Solobacterium sp.]